MKLDMNKLYGDLVCPVSLVLLKNFKIRFRLLFTGKVSRLCRDFGDTLYIYIYMYTEELICKATIRETQRLTIG